jgi:HPt (histidine-containing phosphotransfer) domain-containing protein
MEKVTDLEFITKFSSNDKDRIKKYVNMYLQTAAPMADQMQKYFDSDNMEQVKTAAHTLKSQTGYMGMTRAQEILKNIEHSALIPESRAVLKDHIQRVKELITLSENELKSFLANN